MPTLTQQDIWKYQLMTYFITKQHYRLVKVRQLENEIWLVNPESLECPLIRIAVRAMDSDLFNQERTDDIHRTILNVFGRDGNRLELFVYPMPQERMVSGNTMMHVYPGAAFNERFRTLFPQIEGVCHNVSDLAVEYTSLNKQVQTFTQQEIKKERKKRSLWRKEHFPYVTLVFGILCIANYIFGMYLQTISTDSIANAIVQGAYYKAFVVGLNEWFRFFTSAFVHFDIFHVMMNMMALYYMGAMCERVYGKWRYLILLVGSILCGSLFVFIGDANVVAGGLSGGLYGLLGAIMVHFIEQGQMKNRAIRNQFMYMIGVNIMISLMANVSWLAHFGGFVGGAFLAVICTKKVEWKPWRINFAIAFVLLVSSLGVLLPRSSKLDEVYLGTDRKVVEIAKQLHLDWYGDHVKNIYHYYTK